MCIRDRYVEMTPPLVILALDPTKYYTEPDESPRLTSPTRYTFTVNTSSQGLDLTSAGDEAKVVFGTSCSDDPVADGNSIVTDLGPSDAVDATSASFEVEFITAGEYTVCYKNTNNGSVFTKVDMAFMVEAVQPVRVSPSSVKTNTTYLFSLSGGSGLDVRSGKDKVVVVASTTACSQVDSTYEESVIGALEGEVMSATRVGFNHSFEKPGTYQVCYKRNASASFSEVNPDGQIVVGATAPSAYRFEGTLQSETENTIVLTGGSGLNSSAGGDAVKLVELVSAGSLGTPSRVQAYLDTLGCSEAGHATVTGGPNPVTDLDEVLSGRTVARHKFDMQKSGTYIVCYKVRGGSYERVGESFEISAVGPTGYNKSDQRAGWPLNLSFVGQGLDTRSGRDAVKVVTGSACASSDPLNEHSNLALKTVPATDLESTVSDDGHTTQSYATFTFPKAGTYTVCYQLAGKQYVEMLSLIHI